MMQTYKEKAAQFQKEKRQHQRRSRVVVSLALVVAILTTNLLILPAVTMENEVPPCGHAEHVHGEGCYAEKLTCLLPESEVEVPGHDHIAEGCAVTQEPLLICSEEEWEAHQHGDECSGIVCGLDEVAEADAHAHGETCYGLASVLTCTTPETAGHAHIDSCYASLRGVLLCAEPEGHQHTNSCYTETTKRTCATAEHAHNEGCFGDVQTLNCADTAEDHTHGDVCYTTEHKQTCAASEHTHGDGCFATVRELKCGEALGHQHTDSCYEALRGEQTCTEAECAPHAHGAECTTQQSVLRCELPEIAAHTHDESCTGIVCDKRVGDGHAHGETCWGAQDVYGCGKEVCESIAIHAHSEACYEIALICTIPEHTHDQACDVIAQIGELPAEAEIRAHFETLEGQDAVDYIDSLFAEVGAVLDAYNELTEEQQLRVTNADKLMALVEPLQELAGMATLEIPDLPEATGDFPVDFYRWDGTNWVKIEGASGQNFGYQNPQGVDGDSRDYIPLSTLEAVYGPYGFDPDAMDRSLIARQFAYCTALTVDSNSRWFGDTYLNNYSDKADADLPAEKTDGKEGGVRNSDDMYTLSSYGSGYSIAYLPGNTLVVNHPQNWGGVPMADLKFYCEGTTNPVHSGITMNLFNYGSNIDSSGQNELAFYSVDINEDTNGKPKEYAETDMDRNNNGYYDGRGSNYYSGPLKTDLLLTGSAPTGTRTYDNRAIDTAYLFSPDSSYKDFTYEDYLANRKSYDYNDDNHHSTNYKLFHETLNGDGGLFQTDAEGYLYYDSALNAASYIGNGQFKLYDYSVGPKHIDTFGYTEPIARGNFLPFNNSSVIQSNTERNLSHNGQTVTNYLLKENTDLWFGMTMEFDFFMPENGKINSNPMEFDFYGDDDVWVYIDDILVLDISGCHGAKGGSINFATGAVNNPTANPGEDRAPNSVEDAGCGSSIVDADGKALYNLRDIFAASGKYDSEQLNEIFNADGSFKDYTRHNLKFFYMERGGNISYCRLKFNLPTLPAKSLVVGKDVTVQGDSDKDEKDQTYMFQVVDASGQVVIKNVTGYLFDEITGQTDTNSPVRVDAEGIFTLTDGQRVQFANMEQYFPENMDGADMKYYVRELILADEIDQYSDIKVGYGSDAVSVKDYAMPLNYDADPEPEFYGFLLHDSENNPVFSSAMNSNMVFFTNELALGDLTIHKTVELNSVEQNSGTFQFRLTSADLANKTFGDVAFDADGKTVVSVTAGTPLTIYGLPAGAVVEIEEINYDGYAAGWKTMVDDGNGGLKEESRQMTATTTATVKPGQMVSVHCVNVTGAMLPETGGIGTNVYYAVGILMMLCAGAVLVLARREERIKTSAEQ